MADMMTEYTVVTLTLMGQTNLAFKVRTDGNAVWIPKSVIHENDMYLMEDASVLSDVTVYIEEWKAIEQGWI